MGKPQGHGGNRCMASLLRAVRVMQTPYIGTAAWNIPAVHRDEFLEGGSILARYATRLCAVEINTSFYRPHRRATYERWAATVPPTFRFSVKLPRAISHEHRLVNTQPLLDSFLGQVGGLGGALGPLLLQLPRSATYDERVATAFFAMLRDAHTGRVVVEARHPSWFTASANASLESFAIASVAADPACVAPAAQPAGARGLVYYRLHGSPVMYRSPYDATYLAALARELQTWSASGADVWCIFDNTATGAAVANALELARSVATDGPGAP